MRIKVPVSLESYTRGASIQRLNTFTIIVYRMLRKAGVYELKGEVRKMGARSTQTVGGHKSHVGGKKLLKKRRERFHHKAPGQGRARRRGAMEARQHWVQKQGPGANKIQEAALIPAFTTSEGGWK